MPRSGTNDGGAIPAKDLVVFEAGGRRRDCHCGCSKLTAVAQNCVAINVKVADAIEQRASPSVLWVHNDDRDSPSVLIYAPKDDVGHRLNQKRMASFSIRLWREATLIREWGGRSEPQCR